MLNFRTLYKSQHHKSLYLRVAGIHRFDDAFLASLKASKRVSFYFHKVFFNRVRLRSKMIMIRIPIRNRKFHGLRVQVALIRVEIAEPDTNLPCLRPRGRTAGIL